MAKVFPGRYTADVGEDGAVLFLIGMRFNHWWRIDKWWPVFVAMPRMLRHLAADPDSGLLGVHLWPGRTVLVLQYWRSAEELIAFASDAGAPHAAAWREFNRRIGTDGSVGIWHETYEVRPGHVEAVYGNMPAFGLAAATSHVPVTAGRGNARARLRRRAV
ncbi:MAG: DUF4188 domain-containing protein [Actinomycetota bacterium]|nr:DUF4188 domain-containing protein [Actinomycetota bacterium]